jgi:hypothetical protein
MTKMRSLFLLLVAVLMLQSCVVEQNYLVNADKSGKYQLILDMSTIAAMSPDSTNGGGMSDEDLKKMTDTFQKISGITNVNASFENYVLRSSFDFKDFSTIKRLSKEEENIFGGLLLFEGKKNKVNIDVNRKTFMASKDTLGQESIDQMNSMITMKFKIQFEQPIKKIKSDVATLDATTNSVEYSLSLNDIFDPKKSLKTQVQLK